MTGADDVDYAWYVLDDDDDDYTEATAVGTKSTYKVGQADLGKYILVVVEDEDGDVAASDVTSAVAEKDVELPDDQIEGVISIEDVSGLQSDGTGLIGDTLRAVVPATMGSFSNVIFYRDGKQLNSTTQNGAEMFTTATRPGKYTVSVIGSDNKVYLSDSIDVVDTEARAIVQAFSIEDDYSTPNIDINANGEDYEAVISVSLNKAYSGNISIYKATDLKYTGAAVVTESTVVNAGGGAGNVDNVLAMPTTAQVAAATNGNVLRYVDPETGVATYKFTVAATVGEDIVRGTEYKVIFDQANITDDTAGMGTENEGPNTVTAPYLETPAYMNIDSAGNGQPVVISFKNADDQTMTWMGNPAPAVAANTLLSQIKVYSDKDNDMKDGTDKSATTAGSTILKGVMTTDATGDANAFYYATAKTVSGLFGPKAIDIASTLGTAAQPAATAISISQNSSDPYAADVKFENLRCDGTVYILQSSTAGEAATGDVSMITSYTNGTHGAKVAEKVTSGTKSVTIAGGIDAIANNKNHYLALFIPDDLTNYSQVFTDVDNAGDAGTIVAPKLTTYKVEGTGKFTSEAASSNAAAAFDATTETALLGYDQFGDAMPTVAYKDVKAALALTCSNPTVATTPGTATTVTLAAHTQAGEIGYGDILVNAGGATVNKGEKWTTTLSTGQTLTFEATEADGTAKATAKWKVSVS